MRYCLNITFAILTALTIISCSSVPKGPAEITNIRGYGKTQLQLANLESDKGNYELALDYLEGAWGYAAQSDDPDLRIKVMLSRGNVYLYRGRLERARLDWDTALAEAQREGMNELAAAAKIHIARGMLLDAIGKGNADAALAMETELVFLKEMDNIKKEQTYLALAWAGAGLAEKEQGLWDKAEASLKNSLKIHESGNYLKRAAYDWYLIASVRSKAGNYASAVDALMQAVSFDRRAENSHGLGSDWTAVGDVYVKMGERGKAENAYLRAIEIFTAASMVNDLDMANKKLENLKK